MNSPDRNYGWTGWSALEIIGKTGGEPAADRAFRPLILSPIEAIGVDKLADGGVTVKARIKNTALETSARPAAN